MGLSVARVPRVLAWQIPPVMPHDTDMLFHMTFHISLATAGRTGRAGVEGEIFFLLPPATSRVSLGVVE